MHAATMSAMLMACMTYSLCANDQAVSGAEGQPEGRAIPIVSTDGSLFAYIVEDTTGGFIFEQLTSTSALLVFPLLDLGSGRLVVRGTKGGEETELPSTSPATAGNMAAVTVYQAELASMETVSVWHVSADGEEVRIIALQSTLGGDGGAIPKAPPTLKFTCTSPSGCTITVYVKSADGLLVPNAIPLLLNQEFYSTGAVGVTCPGCTSSVVPA